MKAIHVDDKMYHINGFVQYFSVSIVNALIKKYLICFHIIPLICMIDVCTLSNKCFWILNLDTTVLH